jgi:hypothetical protein
LPGEGLGGLDTTSAYALFTDPYDVLLPTTDGQGGTIREIPIEVSGSKSLQGQWWEQGNLPAQHGLQVDRNGLLTGYLRNPLAVELSDCRVMYQNWTYPVSGSLSPGGTFSFSGATPRNLQWHLNRRRVVDTKDVGTPWDHSSFDVPRMMEVMMFYRAAGGEAYTGLTHRYTAQLDLSDHLRGGRAILVGRAATPAARLLRGGQSLKENYDRKWTIYRIVFPVDNPAS